jgi:capsular exopolysaccharide synthesis family protein
MLILLRVEIRDADIQEIDLLNELRSIRKKTDLLMERKIEFDRRKRRVEYYRNMTALLEEKNQEALIRKAEKPEEISVVRPALLPTVPVNPPKTAATGAIGFIIGMVLGLVTALVVETFDTSLGAIEDVEQTIGAPVLGVIPQVDAKQVLMSLKEKFPDGIEDLSSIIQSPHIISHFAPMSIIAESFRALRTSIQFKEADHPIKSIGITSASPQEGKTFVSLNFSITMAQAGMKVLLVGADMRKPMLSKALGLENTPGLSDVLLGSYSWRDSIKTITDIIMGKIGLDGAMITPGLDNLHIITSGAIPPNPAELIESKGIGAFVKEAERTYDIIIFDAPPILSTADAAIVATKMDSVLLVYRVGTVSRGLLKRSVTQLEQAKSNILGVVLNGMRPEISPDFHDFRYYKYDYAYTSKEEEKKKRKSFWFGGNRSRKGEAPTEEELAKGAIMDLGKQKTAKWKLPLGLAALALLVSGVLWQNGVISPFKLLGSESFFQEEHMKSAKKTTSIGDANKKGVKKGAKNLLPGSNRNLRQNAKFHLLIEGLRGRQRSLHIKGILIRPKRSP